MPEAPQHGRVGCGLFDAQPRKRQPTEVNIVDGEQGTCRDNQFPWFIQERFLNHSGRNRMLLPRGRVQFNDDGIQLTLTKQPHQRWKVVFDNLKLQLRILPSPLGKTRDDNCSHEAGEAAQPDDSCYLCLALHASLGDAEGTFYLFPGFRERQASLR